MPTLQGIRSRYRWNAAAARWTSGGRFVSEAALKRELVRYADAAGAEIKELAAAMARGEIPIGQWQQATAARIKSGTLAMELAAKGGRLTARDYGRIGARLKRQFKYLQGFALDVEAGRLSAKQIVARAGLYASGFSAAYEAARRDAAAVVYAEERRLLSPAEHCTGCIEEAAKGWAPIGTLKVIGDSPCRANCRCRWVFRA